MTDTTDTDSRTAPTAEAAAPEAPAPSKTFWEQFAQRARVPAGTALGVVFLVFMHPSARSLYIGGVFALAGALVRLWAAGHIEKRVRLAQSGPYAFTRNPLYFGSFFMALGVILAGQGYWLLPFFALFFFGVYFPVMRAEEQDLLAVYGGEFADYARRVPLFVPRPSPGGGGGGGAREAKFRWSRVRRNREHRNLASLLAVALILVARYFIERHLFR
ncbi:MAG: isoprenylcysteine carboxylmethyltransferase family protein [Acidobacteriota bacterium]|jgi:protein-S-isoprenylcysteine O-methyltransferase Ste14|nr:isoprenylcysteine carboxylmethyltransferase family protein [Acidobacteriota bacterium]